MQQVRKYRFSCVANRRMARGHARIPTHIPHRHIPSQRTAADRLDELVLGVDVELLASNRHGVHGGLLQLVIGRVCARDGHKTVATLAMNGRRERLPPRIVAVVALRSQHERVASGNDSEAEALVGLDVLDEAVRQELHLATHFALRLVRVIPDAVALKDEVSALPSSLGAAQSAARVRSAHGKQHAALGIRRPYSTIFGTWHGSTSPGTHCNP